LIWRIAEQRAFQELARNGRRARTQSLWCNYLNDPGARPPRVGFSIGRTIGPATTRNRLRRRLRSIVADHTPELVGGWLLIGARTGAAERTFAELRGEITTLLARVAPTPSAIGDRPPSAHGDRP